MSWKCREKFGLAARREGTWAWVRAQCHSRHSFQILPAQDVGRSPKHLYRKPPCLLMIERNQNRLGAASEAGGEGRVATGNFLIPQETAGQKFHRTQKLGAWTSQRTHKCLQVQGVSRPPPQVCAPLSELGGTYLEWTKPWCRWIQQHHPNATPAAFP